jgi:hypothetical protein
VTDLLVPEAQAEFRIGVEALEWVSVSGNQTVLAFRGTYSDGDYANIENWMVDFVLQKSTDKMRDAWVNDANLTWTDEMERRVSHNDVAERLLIRTLEMHLLGRDDSTIKERIARKESFPEELSEAVANDKNLSESIGGLTVDEAEAFGYWKLTKYIANKVVAALPKGQTFLLTGHSQVRIMTQAAERRIFAFVVIEKPSVHLSSYVPLVVVFDAGGYPSAACSHVPPKDDRRCLSNGDVCCHRFVVRSTAPLQHQRESP